MKSTFYFEVRGYELDSFEHVNNANYLNYAEAARWKFFYEKGYIDFLQARNLHPVVTEAHIRYMRELSVFDKVLIESVFKCDEDFIIATQNFSIVGKKQKIAKAVIRMILVDKVNRLVSNLPQFIKTDLQEHNI